MTLKSGLEVIQGHSKLFSMTLNDL